MMWQRLLCICSVLLGSLCGYAAVFTVTTIANTGPGSLRDALQQAAANGTAETDYIYFNISPRITTLNILVPFAQPLPDLSSNLVIDGTTQPSAFLGVSNAKITVEYEGIYAGSEPLILLNLNNVKDIAIYGLFLKANVVTRAFVQPDQIYAVQMQNAAKIQIGAPGKGNVISGWSHAIFDNYSARFGKSGSIVVQSNFLGIETDGLSTKFQGSRGGPTVNKFGYNAPHNAFARIGGNNPSEGNYFNSSVTDVFIQGEVTPPFSDHKVEINNNKFGVDVNGEMIDQVSGIAIWIRRMSLWNNNPEQPSPYIANNYIAGKSRQVGIFIDSTIYTTFTIEKNQMGGQTNGLPYRDTYYGTAILLNDCIIGTIGGATVDKGNIIRYWKQGAIVLNRTSSVAISHNSTYCNRKRAIELINWSALNPGTIRPIPFVTINTISSIFRTIRGTCKPNSIVELFYDDDCDGCEGKAYFASVTADGAGNWLFGGSFDNDHIVATATDVQGGTSEYSRPQIDSSGLQITGAACGLSAGVVCGIRILSGTLWHWENEKGEVVGTDTCLRNVVAGKYFLKLSIGSGTCEEVYPFLIPDYTPSIDSASVIVTPSRCNLKNGSVCGLKIIQGQSWYWEDDKGNNRGSNLCLKNVSAGRYRLHVTSQGCVINSSFYEISNFTPTIDTSKAKITNASCNLDNGSITGIKVIQGAYAGIEWKDQEGLVVGTGYDIYNLTPGKYKMVVKDNGGLCGDSTNFFTVTATTAVSLNATNVQLTNASCSLQNGSIRNIQVVNGIAPYQLRWLDERGNIVATSIDLLNVKAGKYRLKLKDAGPCDTLSTGYFEIINLGLLSLDTTHVRIGPAGCGNNNGKITGIAVTGADRYEWINTSTNVVVSTLSDLTGAGQGLYRLIAYNSAYNCQLQTIAYEIPQAVFSTVQVNQFTKKDASCNMDNGSISVQSLSNNQLYFFKWLKDSIAVVATQTLSINNLSPATYYLIATDSNGCEKSIFKQPVLMFPLPHLNTNNIAVDPDTCSFSTGEIRNIQVTSDVNVQYKWYNINNVIAGTSPDLRRVSAGTYHLEVTDGRGCTINSNNYIIPDAVAALPTPKYKDQTIVRYSNTSLKVLNPYRVPVTYQLFDSPTASLVLDENTTGEFFFTNVKADREVFIRINAGGCRSKFGSALIKVVDETIVEIPNAFSPNGDGINDEFHIKVTGLIYVNYLKIFNRWGQVVFETRDINNFWKGTRNGQALPVGTYYYILDATGGSNKKIFQYGSVTLIR